MHWVPLESNPDVINQYVARLGLDGDAHFVDVWGTDPGFIMISLYVVAIVLT